MSNVKVGDTFRLGGTGRWANGMYEATVVDIRSSDDTIKIQYKDGRYKRCSRAVFEDIRRAGQNWHPSLVSLQARVLGQLRRLFKAWKRDGATQRWSAELRIVVGDKMANILQDGIVACEHDAAFLALYVRGGKDEAEEEEIKEADPECDHTFSQGKCTSCGALTCPATMGLLHSFEDGKCIFCDFVLGQGSILLEIQWDMCPATMGDKHDFNEAGVCRYCEFSSGPLAPEGENEEDLDLICPATMGDPHSFHDDYANGDRCEFCDCERIK